MAGIPQVTLLDALPMSRKQVRSIVQSTSRVNLWTGAIRSGKTIASLVRWLAFIADAPHGGQLVMIGRTRESVSRNVFAALQDPSLFGPLAAQVKYTPGAPSGYILGRKVWVFGASDVRASLTIQGLTVAGAYVDEATLMSEAFWNMLVGRMSVPGAQLFATMNPDSPSHWMKTTVVDRAPYLGYRTFHFVLEDNKWLTDTNPDYVARIKREYMGLWYRRFILGLWVQAEGAVYDQWDEQVHVIPHGDLPVMDHVVAVGIDYGQTNPTRGVMVGIGTASDTKAPQLYAIDEWVPTPAADVDLSAQLRNWLATREVEMWREPEWLFVDPAAASFKRQLFDDGVQNVANGHNAVVPGIRTIGSLLATRQLQVSDRCTKLVEQIPGYAWDPKATAKGEDKPLKVNDHEVDALRYAVHSSRALWRDTVPVQAGSLQAPGADEMIQA